MPERVYTAYCELCGTRTAQRGAPDGWHCVVCDTVHAYARRAAQAGEREALRAENDTLRRICVDLQWMARRYADGRCTYAALLVNQATRALLALGVSLNPNADGTLWARDGMGRAYDGLTAAEAAEGDQK